MKIKYVGPAERVDLAPSAGGLSFVRGETVDVDERVARSLLDQETFVRAAPPEPSGRGSASRASDAVETR